MVQQTGTQVELDLFAPAARADPYPGYRRQREAAPIARGPGDIWFLTRHDDCSQVLRDLRFGHTEPEDLAVNPIFTGRQTSPDSLLDSNGVPVLSFLVRNPPDHTRMRRLVSKAFTPRMVALLAPRIEQLVDELLDD